MAKSESSPGAGNPRSGLRSLHLRVERSDATSPEHLEASAVWVHSPPVVVEAGEVVKIHGWIRIPEAITGGVDGLLIFDSLGGPALAQHLGRTSGWQEFTMVRAAATARSVNLTIALAGFGDVWLDDITIRPVATAGGVAINRDPDVIGPPAGPTL